MKVYVIYEFYNEYNQFEGSWDNCVKTFTSIPAANKWIKMVKSIVSGDYKNVIGPLVKFKK